MLNCQWVFRYAPFSPLLFVSHCITFHFKAVVVSPCFASLHKHSHRCLQLLCAIPLFFFLPHLFFFRSSTKSTSVTFHTTYTFVHKRSEGLHSRVLGKILTNKVPVFLYSYPLTYSTRGLFESCHFILLF